MHYRTFRKVGRQCGHITPFMCTEGRSYYISIIFDCGHLTPFMCTEGRSYVILAIFDKIQHNHRTFSPIISDHFSHKSSIFSVKSVVIYGEVFPKIVDFLSIADFVGGICFFGAKSRLYIGFLDHSKMQFISLQELYLTK